MKAVFMKTSASAAMHGQSPLASPDSSDAPLRAASLPPLPAVSAAASSAPDSPAPRRAAKPKIKAAPKTAKNKANQDGAPGDDALEEEAPEPGDDAKKRVRLKPETREQLLERLRNPPLSLHETSILLRVSRATVRRYADAGRLPCLRTPGGQRRFALRDIENFYRQLKR